MASKHVFEQGKSRLCLPAHACPGTGLQRLPWGLTPAVGCVTCVEVPVRGTSQQLLLSP